MPDFDVPCVNRKTGQVHMYSFKAATLAEAYELAAAEGLIVQSPSPDTAAPPSEPTAPVDLLAAIHRDLAGIRESLDEFKRVPIVRAPVGTIAIAVIVAWVVCGVVGFVLWGVLGGR